jgi:hydroxymethylglutaryl-CoA synthase
MAISFGSGAGSDAFSLRVTDLISERQGRAIRTQDYIARRHEIDYAAYVRYRKKLHMQ